MFNTVFVQPLFNLLAIIYATIPGHDFGVAVIILTALVRLLLWPVTARQLHSQRVMQQIQPELAAIKKKAAGDRQKESSMLMDLYKQRGVNPLASLVPVLLQLPLFFALFIVLRDIVKPGEIAHLSYSAVQHLSAIADIIASRAQLHTSLLGLINLAKPSLVLAVLAGGAQFFQTRQLLPQGQDASAQAMNSMTYIFPVLTVVIGLKLPGALALYWTVNSLVGILQQTLLLRQDVQELEAVKK